MKKLIGPALISILVIAQISGCTQKTIAPTAAEPVVLKDGTYSGIGTADKIGWVPEITLTISQGKIASVNYDEAAAMRKSENIEYQKSFKAQNKIDLLSVYKTLQNSLIKSQDATKLDTVAGATKSAENFKTLAAEALKNAKADNKYIDGDYSAAGSRDEKNWTPVINISVKDGKITAVKYDEISSRIFKYKSKDAAYVAKYKEKSKLELPAVFSSFSQKLIENQNPTKLDSVAGATESFNSFEELATQAIEQAKQATIQSKK